MFRIQRCLFAAAGQLACLADGPATAGAVSESLIHLQVDDERCLQQRSQRSQAAGHRFHVDRCQQRDAIHYIDPDDVNRDDTGARSNVRSFDQDDRCLGTAAGLAVDANGCEADTDRGGAKYAADL